ncbi:hypothetical protein BZA05DRAFT_64151 [Tricharina praecox]|uniref:uncharacterized protein n=1 Tax=Tricharina praecox TaxID=43433 RepID=UPI00221EAAC0|nr:uncharacterized protein BZA05DRAFT_64151 [Tricharina praecox]KAI5849953.1 hypothetical protein BZA05DRAFT_64151 [Tricharina praecox]
MLRSSTYHHHGYAMALLGWGVIFKGVLISGLLFDFLLFLCLLFQLAMRVLLFGLDWRGIAFGFLLDFNWSRLRLVFSFGWGMGWGLVLTLVFLLSLTG